MDTFRMLPMIFRLFFKIPQPSSYRSCTELGRKKSRQLFLLKNSNEIPNILCKHKALYSFGIMLDYFC